MSSNILGNSVAIPAFQPPGGYGFAYISQMLAFGRQIRDELVWQYPLLPGAIFIWQQIASSQEWKITGGPRSVARAVEWYNNAQCLLYNGTVDYGFEPFLKRRALDYPTVGRTVYHWGIDGAPLRYLDPTTLYYDMQKKVWVDGFTREEFQPKNIAMNHPIPIGNNGNFISPLSFVIPTAMLAWLIREHDRAAADGRKIRDIIMVASDSMRDQIKKAVVDTLKLWTGESNASTDGIPVISFDPVSNGLTSAAGVKMSDMIATFGIANIPPSFNRDQFQFQYVNEISDATGLALRSIWNSEKATNRALEEVQEARQGQKGPAAFIRTEERLHNQTGELEQFGSPRFNFIEQADKASRLVDAQVLKLYAESFQIFVTNLGGDLNIDALVGWLQRDDILPADLDIITNSIMENPETPPAPIDGNVQQNSDATSNTTETPPKKKKIAKKPIEKAVEDVPDYDEISMNSYGQVIERRYKVIGFSNVLKADPVLKPIEADEGDLFEKAVRIARQKNIERFITAMKASKFPEGYTAEQADIAKTVFLKLGTEKAVSEISEVLFDENDHRLIKAFLDAIAM